MDTVGTKQELLEHLRQERAGWDALLAEVGEARMTQPGPMGEWSFKDFIAHMVAWAETDLVKLNAALTSRPLAAPRWPANLDTEAINDWIYRQNKDRPLSDVLGEASETWNRFESAVRTLPAPDLTQPGRFEFMKGRTLGGVVEDFFGHFHEEHESAIRSWLAESRA